MKKSPNASKSARYAAEKASPEDLAALGAALEANRQAVGDVRKFGETDVAFHYAIARDADDAELQMRAHLAQVAGLYARVTGGGAWAPM
jgi:DNA-binding FadR family transcriptional regulator